MISREEKKARFTSEYLETSQRMRRKLVVPEIKIANWQPRFFTDEMSGKQGQ